MELGPSALIRTVHGRGYQFASTSLQISAPRHEPDEAMAYFLEWTGGRTALLDGQNFIGRREELLSAAGLGEATKAVA